MVQLRREMEGLGLDPARIPPAWWNDVEVRKVLDRPVRAWLAERGPDEDQRVLAAGVGPHEITQWLHRGCQVSVVEDDPERARAILRAAGPRWAGRLNVQARAWGDVRFERASFDVIVLNGELNRYGHAINAGRKAARELKMGGRLLVRLTVEPLDASVRGTREAIDRLPGALRHRAHRAASRLRRGVLGEKWTVDAHALLEGIADIARPEETRRFHALPTVLLAAAAARLRPGPTRRAALGALRRAVAAERGQEHPTAVTVCAECVKDVGLGRVFLLR